MKQFITVLAAMVSTAQAALDAVALTAHIDAQLLVTDLTLVDCAPTATDGTAFVGDITNTGDEFKIARVGIPKSG